MSRYRFCPECQRPLNDRSPDGGHHPMCPEGPVVEDDELADEEIEFLATDAELRESE